MTRDDLLQTLRLRIFLAAPTTDLIFRGTEIATEFGLSRTPVRQIFERLEAEGLVTTRPGIGTVAPALDLNARDIDFAAHRELCLACARLSGRAVPQATRLHLSGASQMLQEMPGPDMAFFVTNTIEFIDNVSQSIESPILAEAFRKARWKITRWRTLDAIDAPQAFWDQLKANTQLLNDYVKQGDMRTVFEALAGLRLEIHDPTPVRSETVVNFR